MSASEQAPAPAAEPRGWFDRLVALLAGVAGVLLCALTLLICVDVAARSLRLFPMPWSLDVAEYLLYAITFLGAPWVLLTGGHIRVDLLSQYLQPAARRAVERCASALGALVCLVLLGFSVRVGYASYVDGTMVYETFVFPEWLLFTPAPPVFLLMLVIFLRDLVAPRARVLR